MVEVKKALCLFGERRCDCSGSFVQFCSRSVALVIRGAWFFSLRRQRFSRGGWFHWFDFSKTVIPVVRGPRSQSDDLINNRSTSSSSRCFLRSGHTFGLFGKEFGSIRHAFGFLSQYTLGFLVLGICFFVRRCVRLRLVYKFDAETSTYFGSSFFVRNVFG